MQHETDAAMPGADRFRPCVGTPVGFAGTDLEIVLTAVEEDGREPPPGIAVRAFSLLFRGPRDRVLPEGLHRCTFADGTVLDMHVAPIHTPFPDGQDYEAAFN